MDEETWEFEVTVIGADGEYVATCASLGLSAAGTTFDDAIEQLGDLIAERLASPKAVRA